MLLGGPSSSCTSSSVSSRPTASTASGRWWGLVAPTFGAETSGLRRTHASAIWAMLTPRDSASLCTALIQKLIHQSYGPWLLGLTAAGMVAYGLFSLVRSALPRRQAALIGRLAPG